MFTHTHIVILFYISTNVCVCVCVKLFLIPSAKTTCNPFFFLASFPLLMLMLIMFCVFCRDFDLWKNTKFPLFLLRSGLLSERNEKVWFGLDLCFTCFFVSASPMLMLMNIHRYEAEIFPFPAQIAGSTLGLMGTRTLIAFWAENG